MTGILEFVRFLWALARRFGVHDGAQSTAHIAFTSFVGVFPFLVVLVLLAGFLGELEAAERFAGLLLPILPEEVADTLRPAIEEVMQTRRGGLLTISVLTTLWVASSSVEALRVALNRAFDVDRVRPFWRRRLEGLGVVLLGAGAILAAMILAFGGPALWPLLAENEALGAPPALWRALRYLLPAGLVFLTLSGFYLLLPDYRLRWYEAVPGAAVATALWALGVRLFSEFMAHVPDYSLVYGGLAGVIVALVFFYFLAFAFVLGGEINAELRRRSRHAARTQRRS